MHSAEHFAVGKFQLTRPVRGEPRRSSTKAMTSTFQLTRPVRGEPFERYSATQISINFNSLAPCGANLAQFSSKTEQEEFQLTRPVRGEPKARRDLQRYHRNFNSLAPCGANPAFECKISNELIFQLTRPVRGEPRGHKEVLNKYSISTHSPRAGRTVLSSAYPPLCRHFNSLAPCGANRA